MSFVSFAFDFSVCSRSARSAASSFCSPLNLHLLELRQVAQLELEDRFGLHVAST